jgi:hypothetical protein
MADTTRHDTEQAQLWARNIAAMGEGCYVGGSTSNTVDELNALTIREAMRAGWRGATDDDLREIRRMLACTLGDGSASGPAALPYWHPSATDEGLSEALGWVADDALDYLGDVAPDGYYVHHDDGLYVSVLDTLDA